VSVALAAGYQFRVIGWRSSWLQAKSRRLMADGSVGASSARQARATAARARAPVS
jgi:hypothetical protein